MKFQFILSVLSHFLGRMYWVNTKYINLHFTFQVKKTFIKHNKFDLFFSNLYCFKISQTETGGNKALAFINF